MRAMLIFSVIAGLDPGIHALLVIARLDRAIQYPPRQQ
jgi:hypothetical protein